MSQHPSPLHVPRKSPVQARSAATVATLHEAAIQVLLCEGAERLTTTRVAERAGVSVGTLYQYYPHKQSLLHAVLEGHLAKVAAALQIACKEARGWPMADVVKHVIEAFVDAKMARSDISVALYQIAAEIDGPALARKSFAQAGKALEKALSASPDWTHHSDAFAYQMLFAAMAGATKSVLEAGALPAMVKKLRRHLVVLGQSYLAATQQAAAM